MARSDDPAIAPTVPPTVPPTDPPAPARAVRPGEEPTLAAPGELDATATDELPTIARAFYQVDRELARGGMGRIFTARDRRLGRRVAVKEILAPEHRFIARFEREVRLTARLQHPGIVSIYEGGRWPSGEPFYAMRLIAGRPLDEVIAATTSLTTRLALVSHVLAIAEAVAYAHGQRIIHRDLKPANVLVGTYGETVVIDWGLAKDLDDVTADHEAVGPYREAAEGSLTVLGSVMGTPSYMPIEQATGKLVDERADVYAIGAILYQVLCGALPYEGRTADQIISKLLEGAPVPLDVREPGVPRDLLAIVERAMARDPETRYRTAKALADELKAFVTGQLVASHVYSRWQLVRRWLRRHRAAVAVAAVAAVVLAGIGIASYRGIVAEKRRADGERDHAQAAAKTADDARAIAIGRADDLTIAEARRALDIDPTAALAWIAQLSPTTTHVRDATMIAADADERGAAWLVPGGGSPVRSLAASADGKVVWIGDAAGALRVFDVASREVRTLSTGTPIRAVALSAAGDHAIVARDDGGVELWGRDGRTPTPLPAAGPHDPVVAISADGARVAFGASAGTLVCAVASATCTTLAVAGGTHAVAFDAAGTRLFVDAGNRVLTYDLSTTPITAHADHSTEPDFLALTRIDAVTEAAMRPFATSADGNTIALYGHDGAIELIGDRLGPRTIECPERLSTTHGLAMSPDARWIACVDGRYLVVNDGHRRETFETHAEAILALAFAPSGMLIAAAGIDGSVQLHDLARSTTRTLRGHVGRVRTLAFVDGGNALVSGGDDGVVRLWRVEAAPVLDASESMMAWTSAGAAAAFTTGQHARVILPSAHVVDIATPVTARASAVAIDGSIALFDGFVWRASTGEVHPDLAFAVGTSERVASIASGTFTVRELATGTVAWTAPYPYSGPPALAGDLASFAAATGTGSVDVVDARGTHTLDPKGGDSYPELQMSSDGRWLLVTGEHATRICDLAASTCRDPGAPDGRVVRHVIATSGRRVATAGDDRSIRVFEPGGGTTVVIRRDHGIGDLALSADGDTLLIIDDQREVVLYDVPSGVERVLPRATDSRGTAFAMVPITGGAAIVVDDSGELTTYPDRFPRDARGLAAARAASNARITPAGTLVAR